MNDNNTQITLDKAVHLKGLFDEIYDENFKPKNKDVYNKKIVDFNKALEEVGVSSKLTPKQIELKLQQLYELLVKAPKFKDQTPNDMPTKTTLNKDESKVLIEEAEKRDAALKQTRENQAKIVGDFKRRGEAIYAEQQKIQDRILKSEAAEAEIKKIKDLYVQVKEIEKVQLTSDEKAVFEEYKNEIFENPDEAKVRLAQEIHIRTDKELAAQGLEQEEADFAVYKTAEKIVEEMKASADPSYLPPTAQLAVNNAVFEKVQDIIPETISDQAKEALLSSMASTSKFKLLPDVYLAHVTETAFGSNVAKTIFGSSYNISISETPIQGYDYIFNFSKANQDGRQIQIQQNQTLETLKGLGQQEAKNYLFDQSAAYFAKSSLGQKVLANPKAEMAFYSVFKGAGQTVTWTSENFVGNAVLRFAPEYAPILNIATGSKFVTPVMSISGGAIGAGLAAQAAATTTSVTLTGGIMAGEAFAGGVGAATAGAAAGTAIAPLIGTAIGAVAGAVGGKVFSAALSKLKVWWTNNKDAVGPAVAVGLGFGGLMLGGPAVGGLALLGGLAAVGALGTFAAGAFELFGFIGRSVGIAIATPVIVTLLVLPPLVAFIMLVINNSAYIVPPTPIGKNIIHIPPGGNLTKCDPEKTGEDITEQLASTINSGSVQLLPNSSGSRKQGLCITPTMIVLHTSGGYDNDDGNVQTYNTLVQRQNEASCQMATDTNDTILMLNFFENQVESSWCQNDLNAGGVGIEMAGEFKADKADSSNHGPFSKCSPEGSLMYTPGGPHPCAPLEDLAFDAVCKVMQKYGIPWTQVFQHEDAKFGSHIDPVGNAWVDKFVLRLKNNCTINKGNNELRNNNN